MNVLPKRRPSKLLRRERRRWDDEFQSPLAMGCAICSELPTCGGLHKRQQGMGCMDDCCHKPSTCTSMCPRNPRLFLTRMREIDGFDLGNVPRAASVRPFPLPVYVPRLYHGSKRKKAPELDAIAIPLHALYKKRDGALKFVDRDAIANKFHISPSSKILLVGCGEDASIEAWWGLSARRREIIAYLRAQNFELVTAPNYSLFTNQLRYDDLHSIKRIAKAWYEFQSAGLPCALHVNSRTTRDYERWAEFIRQRPEITHVAFEFGTVWKWPTRQEFHRQRLVWLAQHVGRPLHMVMVGGMTALPALAGAYDKVTYIDGVTFLKMMKRQRAVEGNDGTLSYLPQPTEPDALLDAFFMDNVHVLRRRVERIVSEAYASRAVARTELMPENLDKMASAPIAPPSNQDAVPKSSTHDRPIETVDRR